MDHRLIPSNSRTQPLQRCFVYVDKSCFIHRDASLVFLSKKSIANAYESFATVRKA